MDFPRRQLHDHLYALGLEDWSAAFDILLDRRLTHRAHGDFERWRSLLAGLPAVRSHAADLDRAAVRVGPPALDFETQRQLRTTLLGLLPWRKGPFEVCGVRIDSEWRSDRKWARVGQAIEPLHERNVLDVGCGNGYYALRMAGAGAKCVIGIDPTLLYLMQFIAIRHFIPDPPVFVLPARLEELPAGARCFDTTFSMGVLYHQRGPIEHLRQLRDTLRPGGQLVLETLFVPGDGSAASTPPDRYARMKNVWLLPTIPELLTWLERCGFDDAAIADRSITDRDEQRSTEWMPFESLADALDPDDPALTVEGWPAPQRVVVTARAPG